MRITVLLAAALMACGPTAALAGEACFAPQSDWSFGGADFNAAAHLDTHTCKPFKDCKLGTSNGIAYALIYDGTNSTWIMGMKQRGIGLGEKLPFGVTTSDTPAQVVQKIKAAGRMPAYGRTRAIFPASVGLACQAGEIGYQFEFNFDVSHRMTNISETPIRDGSLYIDDPTKSFTRVDQEDE
jgi:hypothetical protein